MNKIIKSAFILVLLITSILFTGCISVPSEINIVEDSIPSTFKIDEELPSTASINVLYKSGYTKKIAINSNMIEGFDTKTSGDKTMKITYKGLSVEKSYTVEGDINTPIRLKYVTKAVDNKVDVVLNISSLDIANHGLYAIKIQLKYDAQAVKKFSTEVIKDGWMMSKNSSGDEHSIMLFDPDGKHQLVEDTDILKFSVEKKFSEALLTIDCFKVEMSYGKGLLLAPSFIIEI